MAGGGRGDYVVFHTMLPRPEVAWPRSQLIGVREVHQVQGVTSPLTSPHLTSPHMRNKKQEDVRE